MASQQLKQLVPLPCLCCVLLLLLLSTISHVHAKQKPCKCPGSDRDERRSYTMAEDVVFLVYNHTDKGLEQKSLHNIQGTKSNKTRALSTIDGLIKLCQRHPDGSGVDESSFNISIVMPNQTTLGKYTGFSLLILPGDALDFVHVKDSLPLARQLVARTNLSKVAYQMGPFSDGRVQIATGVLANPARKGYDNGERAMRVDIGIKLPASSSNYSVWIDYDRGGKRLSVYVDVDGKPKPASAIAEAPFDKV